MTDLDIMRDALRRAKIDFEEIGDDRLISIRVRPGERPFVEMTFSDLGRLLRIGAFDD